MPVMVNVRTRERENISAGDAQRLYLEGTHGFEKGKRVNLLNPGGDLISMPTAALAEALTSGYHFETWKEEEARADRKKYGEGALALTTAAVAGAARGPTFGGSDVLITKLFGSEGAKALRVMKEESPWLSTGFEIAGAVLPLLASGGTSLLARGVAGAGVAPRLVSGAGRAVTEKVIAKLGTRASESALTRFTGKVVANAAGAAVEGVVYGAGHAVSEAALGETDLTAQSLLSHATLGALIGGGAGAGFTAGGAAFGLIGGKAAEKIADRLSTGNLKTWLDGFAERRAVKAAVGRQKAAYKQLEGKKIEFDGKLMTREEAAGKWLLRNKIVSATESSLDDIHQGIVSKRDALGKQLDDMLEALDQGVTVEGDFAKAGFTFFDLKKRLLRPSDVAKVIRAKILKRLEPVKAESPSAYNYVAKYLDDLMEEGGAHMSFSRAVSRRRALQDEVGNFLDTKGKKKVIADLSRAWNDAIDAKAEPMLAVLGKAKAKTYRALRHEFSLATELEGFATDRLAANQANRMISPSDYAVGAAKYLASRGAGIAAGGVLGGLPGAVVGAAAHKVIRERGNAVVADMAYRVARLDAINGIAVRQSKTIQKMIKSFVSAKGAARKGAAPASVGIIDRVKFDPSVTGKKPKNREEHFHRRAAELSSIVNNPQRTADRIAKQLENMRVAAPNLANAMATIATRAAHYLWEMMPKDPRAGQYMLSSMSKWKPAESELVKWERIIAAINDPTSVLEDLLNGTINRESVLALKEIYPDLYQDWVTQIMEKITERKDDMGIEPLTHLAILLDMPLHPTHNPRFIAAMQQGHQTSAEPMNPKPGSSRGLSQIAERGMSESERLASRV